MHAKSKIALAVGALVAPVVALSVPGIASANEYISNPPSRQAQCAAGTVGCDSVQGEQLSVEGPKGLTDCSGGNERFAELNDDSKEWKATPVGRMQQFAWKVSAPHKTSSFQYFVGGRRIAEFTEAGKEVGIETVTHTLDFGNLTGKQKVLAVWNIEDTANALYSCIDVNVK
ncbi:lytic polysaccharide monooxygenase auxiliary activity family 9 protein [Aldersonia kunmingensis]|uniref:lytic polysaccharide monooxygenase auxiliary activity family 9 protein n=1 Tax=Aldersonia kunmingensis TaxID=408066 RepID=UPI0008377BB8|nr:lytic polysaccharide monooxygenase auxiliary activity family 9 protein [Aldersonia kunmingensis]